MSNILVITMDFPPRGGGMSVKAHDLVRQWADMGNKVTVLTDIDGDSSRQFTRIVVNLKGHYLWQAYKLSKSIKKIFKANEIDKIFCITWSPPGIAVVFSGVYEKCKWGIAANGFDILDGLTTWRTRFLMKYIFNKADSIVAPSSFLEEKIKSLPYVNENLLLIPNSIDMSQFPDEVSGEKIREKYGLENKKIIMTLCRLHPIKGIDTLVDSFVKLREEFEDLYLFIVGDGPSRKELTEKVMELNLQSKVIFTGWMKHEEVAEYYAACNVFVQSNKLYMGREEGMPISLIEASYSKKPVVATRTGGVGDIIIDGETGFLVEPERPVELAEKIKILLSDNELAYRMGSNGHQSVKDKFDIKANALKMLKTLDKGDM